MSQVVHPTRSRTDPPGLDTTPVPRAPPKNRERSHSYLHRRFHAGVSVGHKSHKSHDHGHLSRFRFPETVQSAIELKPPITFDQVLRREKKSPGPSRRTSSQQQKDINEWRNSQRLLAEEPARKRVSPEQVAKARAENAQREEIIRDQFQGVEKIAMDSTSQLDQTYYNILEKLSLVKGRTKQLQDLSDECRKLHGLFESSMKDVEHQTTQSLDAVGDFSTQSKIVEELAAQLKASKEKTLQLNVRLEEVRQRVSRYEEKHNALDNTRKRQWQMIWGLLLGLLVLFISLLLARNYDTMSEQLEEFGTSIQNIGETIPTDEPVPGLDPHLDKLLNDLIEP